MLTTDDVLILIFLSRVKNFEYDYWTVSKRRENYISSFWLILFSSWILFYRSYFFWIWQVFLSSQYRLSDLLVRRNTYFLLYLRKTQHIQLQIVYENRSKMTNLLFDQIELLLLKTNLKINLWSNLHPDKKKQLKDESVVERRVPSQLRRRIGLPVWRDPSATLKQDVSGNSRERSEEVSILNRYRDDEALRSILKKLTDTRNLKTLHLKYYQISIM